MEGGKKSVFISLPSLNTLFNGSCVCVCAHSYSAGDDDGQLTGGMGRVHVMYVLEVCFSLRQLTPL